MLQIRTFKNNTAIKVNVLVSPIRWGKSEKTLAVLPGGQGDLYAHIHLNNHLIITTHQAARALIWAFYKNLQTGA